MTRPAAGNQLVTIDNPSYAEYLENTKNCRPAGGKPRYRLFYGWIHGPTEWSCAKQLSQYSWAIGPWCVSSAEAIRRAPR